MPNSVHPRHIVDNFWAVGITEKYTIKAYIWRKGEKEETVGPSWEAKYYYSNPESLREPLHTNPGAESLISRYEMRELMKDFNF